MIWFKLTLSGHKRSSFGLLMLDLWIVWRGFLVIVKGGGALTSHVLYFY